MQCSGLFPKIGPYVFLKKIGTGAFSSIWAVLNEVDQKIFACKVLDKCSNETGEMPRTLRAEVQIMAHCQHANIQSGIDFFATSSSIYIIMDYAVGGDLYEECKRRSGLSEAQARSVFVQIVDALEYLHSNNIAHLDIKPENVLLFGDGTVRLTDFGVSSILTTEGSSFSGAITVNSMVSGRKGTASFMAPEVWKRACNKSYCAVRADIWSLGATLFSMITNKAPTNDEQERKEDRDFNHISYPGTFSDDLIDLLGDILRMDPQQRSSLGQIKTHPWLQGTSQQLVPSEILKSWNLSRRQRDLLAQMFSTSSNNAGQTTIVSNRARGLVSLGPDLPLSQVQRSFRWLESDGLELREMSFMPEEGSHEHPNRVLRIFCRGLEKVASCWRKRE